MDLVISEICQCKELSATWLSVNCLLIVRQLGLKCGCFPFLNVFLPKGG